MLITPNLYASLHVLHVLAVGLVQSLTRQRWFMHRFKLTLISNYRRLGKILLNELEMTALEVFRKPDSYSRIDETTKAFTKKILLLTLLLG